MFILSKSGDMGLFILGTMKLQVFLKSIKLSVSTLMRTAKISHIVNIKYNNYYAKKLAVRMPVHILLPISKRKMVENAQTQQSRVRLEVRKKTLLPKMLKI